MYNQIHSTAESNDKAIYHVLGDIEQNDGNYTVEDTIAYLTAERPKPVFPKSEVERAIEKCLEAGWIKVLSEQDCEADRLRWSDDPNQIWSESRYRVGCVDLTLAGWNVFAQMQDQKRLPLREWSEPHFPYQSQSQDLLGMVRVLSV